jgi:hypothetical protein
MCLYGLFLIQHLTSSRTSGTPCIKEKYEKKIKQERTRNCFVLESAHIFISAVRRPTSKGNGRESLS